MADRSFYVYVMTNRTRSTIYIGVTNDLLRRVFEHRNKLAQGFTAKYNLDRLVHYEEWSRAIDAIQREKQLKGWRRSRKNELISAGNPTWRDLIPELFPDLRDSSLRSE